MLHLKKLENKLDNQLAKETTESLSNWLSDKSNEMNYTKIIESNLISELEFHIKSNIYSDFKVSLYGSVTSSKKYIADNQFDFTKYQTDVAVYDTKIPLFENRIFSKNELLDGLKQWEKEIFDYLETLKNKVITKEFMDSLPDTL